MLSANENLVLFKRENYEPNSNAQVHTFNEMKLFISQIQPCR